MPEVVVYMAEGRTDEQKRAMMLDVTMALVNHLGCTPEVVTVTIVESRWTEKMKAGKTFAERYAEQIPSGYHEAIAAAASEDSETPEHN